ncbi:hypothetical protein FEM03_00450 [Phragmitibacter flavus]|uniref:SpoVT-AbrB domain-containing protein n=1 Tax=Phragmitibacter flavus TaxID=2576071 RepID=A0A5R8KK04_9BACT|nr:hypothetical protein [Phragmitibacter flavus]TLD72580.1 hypothetical protein FEM03_00450 [Phragmitibacter flavus]
MTTEITLDKSNRLVLTSAVRRAAGIPNMQTLRAHVSPGRILIEVPASTTGEVVKRGKLKVWTGEVPAMPIEEAVEQARHYTR